MPKIINETHRLLTFNNKYNIDVKEEIIELLEEDNRVIGYAVVLEKAKGDLSHFARRWSIAKPGSKDALTEEILIMLALNIVEAIQWFHNYEDMYYGDLKPGNILIS